MINRVSTHQDRVSNLVILSFGNEISLSVEYSELITDFAAIKTRKIVF